MRELPALPKVSVITMVKDRAWGIEHCVRSVREQDYPNIEHVVQDGASTDGTLQLLQQYGESIALRSEPDRGPMNAYHKALERSTGDVCCMLLSDERFYDASVVSRAVAHLRSNPEAAAIYGDFRRVDTNYQLIEVVKKRQLSFEELFCSEDFISPCAAFIRTEVLKDGALLKPDLRDFFDDIGDFGLWIYIGARYPIKYVPDVMADFMMHDDRISFDVAHCRRYIAEIEKAIDAFTSKRFDDAALHALKRRALAQQHLNYGNVLAERAVPSLAMGLTLRAVSARPALVLARTFWSTVAKLVGLGPLTRRLRRGMKLS